jgi:hypothetical protein
MATPEEDKGRGYDSLYEEFDSPLQQQLRREAYGEDTGQHSSVTAGELQEIVSALNLSNDSRFLPRLRSCRPALLRGAVGRMSWLRRGRELACNSVARHVWLLLRALPPHLATYDESD